MKVRVEFKGCMVVNVGEEDEAEFIVNLSELLRCAPITKNGERVEMRFVDIEQWYPACRGCGCWDYEACPGGCTWIEDDLCSACVPVVTVCAGTSPETAVALAKVGELVLKAHERGEL